jgi:pyridoxal phosphate enzyme (YggS family)
MKFHVKDVLNNIPEDVTVVAATKYFTAQEMRELYSLGITHFGENRVELLQEKKAQLEDLDITWHIIGTLQTKKVKKIINDIDYLHSLDNIKLAEEVNKRRTSPLKCFIQVNISNEESKHGLNLEEVIPFIKEIESFKNIEIIGFMGMAEYTEDETIIEHEFQKLNNLQEQVSKELDMDLKHLSIGMSNDYLIALKHHATFVRLGSVLFDKEV